MAVRARMAYAKETLFYEDSENEVIATDVEIPDYVGSRSRHVDGVGLPDGRIIVFQHKERVIGLIDLKKRTFANIAEVPCVNAYFGGVVIPDGRVVFVPHNATAIGIFNPATNVYSTIGETPGNGSYFGGALLRDGRVLFAPHNGRTVGFFNPKNDEYTTVSGMSDMSTNRASSGCVQLPDGRCVFVPYNFFYGVGIFDPETNAYRNVPVLPYICNFCLGGQLLRDGNVLFHAFGSISYMIFNPDTGSLKPRYIFNRSSAKEHHTGTILFPGRLYIHRRSSDDWTPNMVLDPTLDKDENSNEFNGAVILSDNRVAFLPAWPFKTVQILTRLNGPQRRAQARTETIKAELMAAAWHPARHARWCLDEDERRELAEMGLGCAATGI